MLEIISISNLTDKMLEKSAFNQEIAFNQNYLMEAFTASGSLSGNDPHTARTSGYIHVLVILSN